eukprot:2702219-Prymnesium_polylepis.1
MAPSSGVTRKVAFVIKGSPHVKYASGAFGKKSADPTAPDDHCPTSAPHPNVKQKPQYRAIRNAGVARRRAETMSWQGVHVRVRPQLGHGLNTATSPRLYGVSGYTRLMPMPRSTVKVAAP